MTGTCTSAAAYVLGALPPEERSAFEDHLAGCPACRRAVNELAGLPGLLSRVSPADLVDPPPAPDTLLPRLLRAVRRHDRRRRLVLALVAAAAVLAAVLATAQLVGPGSPPALAMHPVVAVPISATVSVRPEAGGSLVRMDCRYHGQEQWTRPYSLVVTDRSGVRHRLATWRVGPDGSATVSSSVAVAPTDIARIELTTAAGRPLLRLRPPA